jgi:hypothetical protein
VQQGSGPTAIDIYRQFVSSERRCTDVSINKWGHECSINCVPSSGRPTIVDGGSTIPARPGCEKLHTVETGGHNCRSKEPYKKTKPGTCRASVFRRSAPIDQSRVTTTKAPEIPEPLHCPLAMSVISGEGACGSGRTRRLGADKSTLR